MTELNKQIEYLFKLVDNVSSSASQMAQSLDEAGNRIDANLARQDEMRSSVRMTGEALDDQRVRADEAASGVRGSVSDMELALDELDASTDVSLSKQAELRSSMQDTQDSAMANQVSVLTQLTAVMGLKEGLSAVTGGMISLGLVSDDTAKSLGMVNSAFSMMAGAVSMIKSVQAVMTTLNTTSAIGASIDAFRATLTNPAMLGVVALAGGAALGVAGAYLMTNNTTNNNQTTVNIVDTTPAAAQSEILQVVTGGAL